MSLDGQLALMHDKICRYMKTRSLDEIVGLAADGLFALEAALNVAGIEEPEEVEVVVETIPEEFEQWENDHHVARELHEYLEATGGWNKLNEDVQDDIIKAKETLEDAEETDEDSESTEPE